MSDLLFYKDGSYYIIIQKGTDWNIMMEFGNFTTRCIDNDNLDKMEKLELNSVNIVRLIGSNYNLDVCNFDENHYLLINNRWYYIENWKNLFGRKEMNEKRMAIIDKCHELKFYLNIKDSYYGYEEWIKYFNDTDKII